MKEIKDKNVRKEQLPDWDGVEVIEIIIVTGNAENKNNDQSEKKVLKSFIDIVMKIVAFILAFSKLFKCD